VLEARAASGAMSAAAHRGQPPARQTRHAFSHHFQTTPTEVLEVRLLIEPVLARLAALRTTYFDIVHLKHLLERSQTARNPKAWELWDGRLRRMVA
jgi:DNA-binding FadR family transcriptional regulator